VAKLPAASVGQDAYTSHSGVAVLGHRGCTTPPQDEPV